MKDFRLKDSLKNYQLVIASRAKQSRFYINQYIRDCGACSEQSEESLAYAIAI